MAWLGLDRLFLGYSLNDLQKQSDTLDAKINATNQLLVDQGYVGDNYATLAAADITAGNASTGANDVIGSVNSEFTAGAAQGLNNVLSFPGQIVNTAGSLSGKVLWGIIKSIPWWAWLGAVAALFFWMGGLTLLKGRFARR